MRRSSQTRIPCVMMRGGTSKGLYFLSHDLPSDEATRDAVLLAAMGSPDARQIDGLGGADSLTSKVAIISRSSRSDADVDYLFGQVLVNEARVDFGQNCGNILAGVGPFAIESGLVEPRPSRTQVRIHMLNTGQTAVAQVPTPAGIVEYAGEARIDGVPGTAAAQPIAFEDIAGSTCGALLPTGHVRDTIDGVETTCIDNGMPVVILRASDLGRTGYESSADLDRDVELKARIESIRLQAGPLMNLGDVTDRSVPKMCLVAAPRNVDTGGTICTRSFIPHRAHTAIGVFGAVSVATAAVLPGTVCDGLAVLLPGKQQRMSIEHPTGEFTVELSMDEQSETPAVRSAALLRTSRWLFDGHVSVPTRVWAGARRLGEAS